MADCFGRTANNRLVHGDSGKLVYLHGRTLMTNEKSNSPVALRGNLFDRDR